MAVTSAQLQELYVGLLGRAADKGGLDYWLGQLNAEGATLTLENVRANFVNEQAEYKAIYGDKSREDLVKAIYQNLFERTPSADEVNYWATGTVNADQMVVAFLNGASAADKQVVGNKTFVAETYTNTVDTTNFNKVGAAAAIANVDGTAASVSVATAAIANGTLAGSVPAVGLIAKLATANAAVTTLEKATAVSNPTFDGVANNDGLNGLNVKDASVSYSEALDALFAANAARFTTVSASSTTLLTAQQTDAVAAAATAKTNLLANATAAQKLTVTEYDNALAAQSLLVQTAAQTAATNALVAGVEASFTSSKPAAVTFDTTGGAPTTGTLGSTIAASNAAIVAAGGTKIVITDAASLFAALSNPAVTTADRIALVAETSKVATYGASLVSYADKALAVNKADALVNEKASLVDAIDTAATTGAEGTAYIAAAGLVKSTTDTLNAAKTADVALAAVKAVSDQYVAANKAVTDATTAINDFNTANGTKVAVTALTASVDATAKQDVFYFPTKVTTATDVTIGGTAVAFGAGDSIVLGSGYTFNSGALSTGNSNVLEFFLVKGATGMQVVVESDAFGNSTTTVDAAGTVTGSTNAAVITLSGVTADHLSVANGVVSYV